MKFSAPFTEADPVADNQQDSSFQISEKTARQLRGAASSTISIPQKYIPRTDVEANAARWSPSVHTLLEEPPSTLPQRLILGGIVFSVAFGSWTWFGSIEDVGRAQGKLVPKGETYKIQPVELGKISQIAVREGDSVRAGQVLVELDTELTQKEIERLEEMLVSYRIELNQKHSLQDRVKLQAETQAAIARAEIRGQQATIDLAREKAAIARQLLQQQQAEASAYRERQAQFQPLSSVAQQRLQQLRAEAVAHRERIARLKPLEEEGAISQDFIFQAEQELRKTEQQIIQSELQEVSSTREQIFQANQSLRDLEARMTQNQGDLSSALKDAERLQAELSQKQAEALKSQQGYQQQIQQAGIEITQLEAKIAETQNMLVSTQAKLRQKFLKSPVNGTVLSLNVKNAGEVAEAGKVIAEIAPEGAPLVLSAVLPNQEAGFVKKGMPVEVKLDAYPYQDYGLVSGTVVSVSADSKPDEKLGAVYRVEVALDRDHLTKNQQPVEFKAGQTATADIVIRRRRILDLVLDPIKKIQKDGMKM